MGNLKHYYKNREKILAQVKEYQSRPEVKERIKQYREDNRDRRLEYEREYNAKPENKETRRAWEHMRRELGIKSPTQEPEYIAIKNKEYRKSHREEHNADNRRSYQNCRESVDAKNKRWKENNPQGWRRIQLKSQIKYLKSLEPFLNKEYNHIPYLYKVWGDEVKQYDHGICAITDCFETDVQAHHIFQKRFYPKLSLNTNNGISLCIVHHNEAHFKGLK